MTSEFRIYTVGSMYLNSLMCIQCIDCMAKSGFSFFKKSVLFFFVFVRGIHVFFVDRQQTVLLAPVGCVVVKKRGAHTVSFLPIQNERGN